MRYIKPLLSQDEMEKLISEYELSCTFPDDLCSPNDFAEHVYEQCKKFIPNRLANFLQRVEAFEEGKQLPFTYNSLKMGWLIICY